MDLMKTSLLLSAFHALMELNIVATSSAKPSSFFFCAMYLACDMDKQCGIDTKAIGAVHLDFSYVEVDS